ncbi:MAG: acyl-CoA dehydrogenase family protein [Phenylobacterium sp.]|uniref:acyl-CoA dehydrogenase family protein n=1 Tax=Phenylobacterium sp. TaxID=1871053 RepID=UPI001B50B661|nr:acyl-CoA dehydrogenase family protein [Phenylobacterium sp.]MBP7814777.1 acyl-CoA dehydrogenase family protein [Phenylobacterium sp.]MBP9231273.1 acyl-CoA dehydrogenase family protein [Phenylobacterium sp.]MBP9754793.1 acyl-CoA dehydrogenase family protein [Phenylobacterium sp.]
MSALQSSNSDPLEAFREEVRDWLAANFPKTLAGRAPQAGQPDVDNEAARRWKAALCAKGWGTPTWPKAYGGGGLSAAEARVLREEIRTAGGWNPIGWGMGVRMLGPTLLEYGTEAQKQAHIPKITAGESRWCQGYSEPNAGSDLASLQTRAEDRGDHFLVNGQKTWTSGAQYADWCFCLVRTDPTRKHDGISFLLIDMRSPGVEARPIQLISGRSPFCETFFTDVRVPKENLVGPLNGGWTVGKRLLQYERQRSEDAPARAAEKRPIEQVVADYLGKDAAGRLTDSDLRARLTRHLMDKRAFDLTQKRAALEAGNGGPTAATSILKNVSSLLVQERAELLVEAMGGQGLGWEGETFDGDELAVVREWLSGKANTIFAGSYEIQNNIISKRILGLPDAVSHDG